MRSDAGCAGVSELSRSEGSTGGEDLGGDVVRAKEVFLRGVGC